jgi:gliding motility-associated-like protein
VNTEIKIIKRGIATLKYFRIFNRWGQKVFETTDIDEGWNGRFNGNLQPMGVYVYMVEAVTNTGRVFNKQGNITLIR